jgi:hypothetical protein
MVHLLHRFSGLCVAGCNIFPLLGAIDNKDFSAAVRSNIPRWEKNVSDQPKDHCIEINPTL